VPRDVAAVPEGKQQTKKTTTSIFLVKNAETGTPKHRKKQTQTRTQTKRNEKKATVMTSTKRNLKRGSTGENEDNREEEQKIVTVKRSNV